MLGVIQYSFITIFWLPIAAAALYGAGLAIYRLFLSPLAKFPGPKLAALTRKYESYYEAYQNYEYLWKIKELHKQYGELFISLTASSTRRDSNWSQRGATEAIKNQVSPADCSASHAKLSQI